jgi:mono/diheme cytochrome c family protein
VTARTRNALLAVATAAIAVGLAGDLPIRRWLGLEPPLAESSELAARGRRVLSDKCLHCHALIPLPSRVRGWDVHRAYDAIGRLPELNRAMPAFYGTDDERRALAAYLVELGRRDPAGAWP